MAETPEQAAERLTHNIGTMVEAYPYHNMDGTTSFYNIRIHQDDGSKTFRMMADIDGTFVLRRGQKPQQDWPLYGWESLAPNAPVFVVEGEKDVDSLHAIGLAAVTSGGVNSVGSADWSPLAGHQVILWPDNDEPGRRYMDEVRARLETIGCTTVEQVNTDALGLPEKGDCSDWLALHPLAAADDVLALDRGERIATLASIFPSAEPVAANDWPSLGPNALHGLAGEVVNAIVPYSEADATALLIQFLVAIGNVFGPLPHCRVEASRHGLNLFAVLVGETAKGRKGTSWEHIRRLMSLVAPDWAANRVTGGLVDRRSYQ